LMEVKAFSLSILIVQRNIFRIDVVYLRIQISNILFNFIMKFDHERVFNHIPDIKHEGR
jgi:hypothetical protein